VSLIDADTGEVVDVDPSTLTFDRSIFPRKKVDKDLVETYRSAVEAGDKFPPITVLADGRIIGGVHRWHAFHAVGVNIPAVVVDQPDDMSLLLFAASLNRTNGSHHTTAEKRAVAEAEAESNPNVSATMLAERLGTAVRTMSRWVGPIVERHGLVRSTAARLLVEAGWSQRRVADAVGMSQPTISELIGNGQVAELDHLAPTLLADAVSILNGDAADAAQEVVNGLTEQRDLNEGYQRAANRLRQALAGWDQLVRFRDYVARDDVLALLSDIERERIADIERRLHD
jgi:ParB-like chromosome segregation protein Spo0J